VTPFRRLWLAQSVSLLGDFVAVFAVQVAVTFRMHGSPRDMAGVFIAGLIPGMILGPLAGTFADRWDPRRVMISSDLARGVLILLLPFARSLHEIYSISFAISCVSSFFSPAQAIKVPLLVPRERLLAATAKMQQTMQLVRIASPAIASALVGWWGERACYYADAGSFVFSAALLATLRYARPPVASRPAAVWSELATGVRFLFGDPRFSPVVFSMTMGTFAAGCFASLASLYVRDVLHRGPSVLAMISSLIGAGTVAGSTVLGRYSRGRDPHLLIPAGISGVGASILLFAWIPRPIAALIGSAGMGLAVAVVMVAATTLLQGETPPAMRGRVSGAAASLTAFAQLAAMLLSGTWASSIGIRGVFLVSAALLFATAGSAFYRHLKLNKIHRVAVGRHAPQVVDLAEVIVEMPMQVNQKLRGGERVAKDHFGERAA
jgi:DHA3 family macrolide efflux protein-like MFS transporter